MDDASKKQAIQSMSSSLPVLRAKISISQEELAKLMGVSRSTLIAFEKQQRQMTWNTFLSLILIFSQNDETKQLMRIFGIYTDELDNALNLFQ